MYVGTIGLREMISIGLMILFTCTVFFFLGYKMAYDRAVDYANKEIMKAREDFEFQSVIIDGDIHANQIMGNSIIGVE